MGFNEGNFIVSNVHLQFHRYMATFTMKTTNRVHYGSTDNFTHCT